MKYFPLCLLKHFFFFVVLSISFLNFQISNKYYLLLKQLIDCSSKYKFSLLLYAKTLYHFVMIFRSVYSVCMAEMQGFKPKDLNFPNPLGQLGDQHTKCPAVFKGYSWSFFIMSTQCNCPVRSLDIYTNILYVHCTC